MLDQGGLPLALATADLPNLLGGTGTRRWLLAVLDNSELRGAGGFMPVVGGTKVLPVTVSP